MPIKLANLSDEKHEEIFDELSWERSFSQSEAALSTRIATTSTGVSVRETVFDPRYQRRSQSPRGIRDAKKRTWRENEKYSAALVNLPRFPLLLPTGTPKGATESIRKSESRSRALSRLENIFQLDAVRRGDSCFSKETAIDQAICRAWSIVWYFISQRDWENFCIYGEVDASRSFYNFIRMYFRFVLRWYEVESSLMLL